MRAMKPRSILVALGLIAAATIACGEASGSLSPSGVAGNRSGAVITGRVKGVTGLPVTSPPVSEGFGPRATTSLRVTITGTNITTAVDGAGNFTLTGVPPGTVTLQFSGTGISATITLTGVTADDTIRIEVTLTNSGARLDAENRQREGEREIEGRITAINASARTIQVGATTVSVPDTARIRRGGTSLTFADLRVGQDVDVHVVFDGMVFRATAVEVEDEDDDDEDDDDGLNGLTGAVSNLTGTCPSLTFIVRERIVRTSTATSFDGGCSRVRNGVRVEARGTLMADGTLMASRVELED